MAKKSSAISKTHGPIHFEDLEPHHFEDLVRQLIYDFRNWQSIEATGRSGSDGGYDIRAYEKVVSEAPFEDADELEENDGHPMEGNRWMIQCKREKAIGPTKLKAILNEIDKADPPYGYILAAATNFSASAYDTFNP